MAEEEALSQAQQVRGDTHKEAKQEQEEEPAFSIQKNVVFFLRHLKVLPDAYTSLDSNRLTLMYFALSALDVLGNIHVITSNEEKRQSFVNFLYSLQVEPAGDDVTKCGFMGGLYVGMPFDCDCEERKGGDWSDHPHNEGHVAMTYTALCCLLILGDDLARVNRKAIIQSLKTLQQPNGSFTAIYNRGECDPRFVFCACAISAILGDWSGFDQDKAAKFLVGCQSYDGGYGMGPLTEGHGGTTYCSIASLALMDKIEMVKDAPQLLKWCLANQGSGFKGRCNKPEDTCYSYWIGGTIRILGAYGMTSPENNRKFNLSCQSPVGGFGKHVHTHPDILHSYMGLCGLSLMGLDEGLLPVDPRIGLTVKTATKIGLPPLPSQPVTPTTAR